MRKEYKKNTLSLENMSASVTKVIYMVKIQNSPETAH